MLAPRVVCGSWADGGRAWVELARDALPRLADHLRNPQVHVVPHNATFDLLCACAEDPGFLPLIFDAYEAGRVRCTMVRQMLLDVALGMRKFRHTADGKASKATYGLADLVMLYFGEELPKEDTWRLRYGLLDGVPVDQWPPDAVDYAVRDAVEARRIFLAQEGEMLDHFGGPLPNEPEQQRAAWALHLMEAWGIRADQKYVDKFLDHCREEIEKMRRALLYACERCGKLKAEHDDAACSSIWKPTGILKPDGSRTMAEIRHRVVESYERLGLQVPYTDPSGTFPDGQVQTDKETLEETDDPALHVLAEKQTFAKHEAQWGKVCRAAVLRPVCARYGVLMETGRTSCGGSEGQEGTNFQNPPRKGDVRPCFIPRPGWVFGFTDADTIELRSHAQNCLDFGLDSRLAQMLWDQHKSGGPDAHEWLAGAILGVDAREVQARVRAGDKEAEDARQFAKIPNYGFPGGLGAETFVSYAAGQMDKEVFVRWFGRDRDERVRFAQRVRSTWFSTLPENRGYFDHVTRLMGGERSATIAQLQSGRIRGDARFTAICNGFFQGRVADAMKEALWIISWECYVGTIYGSSRLSPLKGSRLSMFLHDEPILEHPESDAHERLERQREITEDCLNRWHRDVPCTSSGVLTRRWYKGAKPRKVHGRVVPVRPEKGDDNKIRWVEDIRERMVA